MRSTVPGKRRRDRGASIVEFAICVPLLLLLIGGMVDFGRAFFTEVMLTNAAREGARTAMYGPAGDYVGRATQAASGVTTPLTVTLTTSCASGATTGNAQVQVTTTFDWWLLKPALSLFGAGGTLPTTLSGKAAMQCGG